jgi:phytoene synthase
LAGVSGDDLAYLTALVRRRDRPRYYASLFAERALRADLMALYGFAVELAQAGEAAREPTLVLMRLAWWRERLEEGLSAGASGDSPALRALVSAARRHALSAAPLLAVIEAHADRLQAGPPATIAEAEDGERRAEAPVFQAGAAMAAFCGRGAERAASHAGAAYGLARRLAAGGFPASLRDGLADTARAHLQLARRELANGPRGALPVFLPLAVVEPLAGRRGEGSFGDLRSLLAIGRTALFGA